MRRQGADADLVGTSSPRGNGAPSDTVARASRLLSRRRFLQAAAAVAGAGALAGFDALVVAGTAEGARAPTALTKSIVTMYAGPGNAEYATVAELPAGTRTTLLGTFGDFVKARASLRAPGGATRTATGFVVRSAFGKLPRLAALQVAKVPWIEHVLVAPDHPQTIEHTMQPDQYSGDEIRERRWLGGALVAPGVLRLTVSANVRRLSGATGDTGGSVAITNGSWPVERADADSRRLSLVEGAGGWDLVYEPGDGTGKHLGRLRGRSDGGIDAELTVAADGRSVVVTQTGTPPRRFALERPFFAPDRFVSLVSLLWKYNAVTVTRLAVALAPNGKVTAAPLPSLRDAAPRGVSVGLWTGEHELGDPRLLPIIARQFGMLVYDGTSAGLRPDLAMYDFCAPDQVVNLAHRLGMRMRFYLPSYSVPARFVEMPGWYDASRWPADKLMTLLHDQIGAFVARYRGYVDEWMVTGETLWDGLYAGNFWIGAVGPSYVDRVLTWTRAADPAGRLMYMPAAAYEWRAPVKDAIVTHISDLKSRGIPLDVIGLEMHVRGSDAPSKADLLAVIERITALGVEVAFTEMDVNLYGVAGSTAEHYAVQGRVYGDCLGALLGARRGVNFTQANLVDHNSWLIDHPEAEGFPYSVAPALFDDAITPKPAFYAVLDALRKASGA